MRLQTHARERHAEQLANVGFVVDYEDLALRAHLDPVTE
jgi:hypothetical protein